MTSSGPERGRPHAAVACRCGRSFLQRPLERITDAENNCLSAGEARPIELSLGAEHAIHNEEHRR